MQLTFTQTGVLIQYFVFAKPVYNNSNETPKQVWLNDLELSLVVFTAVKLFGHFWF